MDTAPARCPGRRPNFPPAFKRKVVEASYRPGASVSLIAREHDASAAPSKPFCNTPPPWTWAATWRYARRDIAVVVSTVSAAKDLSAKAGENLTLAAAANEEHQYSKGKKGGTKTTTQLDNVTQQSAELKAGGNVVAIAGIDLTLVASKISAGNEAYVHADNELQMLAAQDSNYSLYDMSKKGNWGSKKTQCDEVTDVLGGSAFTVTGASVARDSYEASLGLNYEVSALTVGVSYTRQARIGFDAEGVMFKARYAF